MSLVDGDTDTEDVFAPMHAWRNWDARTSPGSVAPETAWRESYQMRRIREYRNIDELRYYAPEQVVLIRNHAALVTVIDVTSVDSMQGKALRAAVEKQFGPIEEGGR